MQIEDNANIQVEITDSAEFHCFRLLLRPRGSVPASGVCTAGCGAGPGEQIEIMLHARSLVDLIHKCSLALCDWQAQTSSRLIQQITGLSEEEARRQGLIG